MGSSGDSSCWGQTPSLPEVTVVNLEPFRGLGFQGLGFKI